MRLSDCISQKQQINAEAEMQLKGLGRTRALKDGRQRNWLEITRAIGTYIHCKESAFRRYE